MHRMTFSASSLGALALTRAALISAALIWTAPGIAQADPASPENEPVTESGNPAAAAVNGVADRFSPATEPQTDLESDLETGLEAGRAAQLRRSLAADFDRRLVGVTENAAEGPGVGAAGRVVERFAPPVAAGSGSSAFAAGTNGQGSLGVSALRPCDTPGAACRNFGGPRAVTVPPNNPIIAGGRPTPPGAGAQ